MSAGKAVIGQSGGPTAVINRSLVGFIKEALNSNFDEIVWSSSNDFTDTLSQQANYLTSQALTYYVKISDSLCYAKDSVSVLSDLIDISLIAEPLKYSSILFFKSVSLHNSIKNLKDLELNLFFEKSK